MSRSERLATYEFLLEVLQLPSHPLEIRQLIHLLITVISFNTSAPTLKKYGGLKDLSYSFARLY